MLPKQKTARTTNYTALNVCITGNPKVGKSTFASQIGEESDVIFAATEKGHDFLEIFKVDINEWNDFGKMVQSLLTEKHSFKHLVIDITDRLYEFAELEVCARNKVKSIADMPFGTGWAAAKRLFMAPLHELNRKGIGITFVTHSKEKEYQTDAVKWTAVGTSMSKGVEEQVLGMCDLVFYAYVSKDGSRKIRTKPTKYIIAAGDRSGKLPEVMDLDAKAVMQALMS